MTREELSTKDIALKLYQRGKNEVKLDIYLPYAMQLIDTYTQAKVLEAVKEYEDDLLSTIDDISNKPWRAARHIRELYEKTDSGLTDWYIEVADDWGLLEEFFSNGGMNTVRELMVDPKFNVNYPARLATLQAELEDGLTPRERMEKYEAERSNL